MNTILGYCRVSTPKQNIDRQERNILKAYPDARVFKECYTGTKQAGRTELEKMLKYAQGGDTIVFDSVSRMSRNAEEGIALYMQLYEQGINLVFLNEPHINSDIYHQALQNGIENVGNTIADIYINATNEVLKLLAKRQIELAFEQAQKEVDDLRERTKQGIETARRNGRQIGQKAGQKLNIKKKAPAMQKLLKHSKSFNGTLTDVEVMRLTGLSRTTFYKYKGELRDNTKIN